MAEEKLEEPKQHQCFKNYKGTSAGMEPTAIVEAFKQSRSMYGLKLNLWLMVTVTPTKTY